MKRSILTSACFLGLLPVGAIAQQPSGGSSRPPAVATGGEQATLPTGSTYWMPIPDQGGTQEMIFPPHTAGAPTRGQAPAMPQGGRYGGYPPPQWDQGGDGGAPPASGISPVHNHAIHTWV